MKNEINSLFDLHLSGEKNKTKQRVEIISFYIFFINFNLIIIKKKTFLSIHLQFDVSQRAQGMTHTHTHTSKPPREGNDARRCLYQCDITVSESRECAHITARAVNARKTSSQHSHIIYYIRRARYLCCTRLMMINSHSYKNPHLKLKKFIIIFCNKKKERGLAQILLTLSLLRATTRCARCYIKRYKVPYSAGISHAKITQYTHIHRHTLQRETSVCVCVLCRARGFCRRDI